MSVRRTQGAGSSAKAATLIGSAKSACIASGASPVLAKKKPAIF